MNSRESTMLLTTLAVVFIGFGLALGFSERGGSGCGSVLKPDTYQAQLTDTLSGMDGYEASCDKALSDGKPLTYGALGLGAVAGLLAIVMAGQVTRTKDEEPDKLPT